MSGVKATESEMFPRSWPWLSWRATTWPGSGLRHLSPIGRGSDEWGRHTVTVGIPYVLLVVIPTKPCDCADMAEFACVFPGCPYQAMSPDEHCVTHDRELWFDEIAERES